MRDEDGNVPVLGLHEVCIRVAHQVIRAFQLRQRALQRRYHEHRITRLHTHYRVVTRDLAARCAHGCCKVLVVEHRAQQTP